MVIFLQLDYGPPEQRKWTTVHSLWAGIVIITSGPNLHTSQILRPLSTDKNDTGLTCRYTNLGA